MIITDFLQEDAVPGSVGTAAIAATFEPMVGGKPIRRGSKPKKLKIKTLKLGESTTPEFNSFDVKSKMTNAERVGNLKKDSAAYGIEDEDGNITKVYVDKNQEHDFKNTLSTMLRKDDKLDVAEILFDLRNTFNILYVDWPKMPEDEETVNVLDKKEGEPGGSEPGKDDIGEPGKEGETPPEEPPMPAEPAPPPAPDSESILLKVIDMLRADADAKKAEATAKAKEAESETAKFSVQLSNIKVKNEEDMLKADEYFKKQSEAKKDQERIAKLAKYRNEVVKNTTYEAEMSFLQTMIDSQPDDQQDDLISEETVSEDLNTEVQQLQTQIADFTARKMRAMKVYDDQLRILQQRLTAKTKQSGQQQQQQQQQQQPTQQAQPAQQQQGQ